MMRRALSSESGFLGFLDRGLGLSRPSLRDQGSGLRDERRGRGLQDLNLELELGVGVVAGSGGRREVPPEKKLDLAHSIAVHPLLSFASHSTGDW